MDILKQQNGKNPIFVIYFDFLNIFIRYFYVFYNVMFDRDNKDVGQVVYQLNFILSFIDKYEQNFPNRCLYNLIIEHGRSKKHRQIRKEYKSNRDVEESVLLDMTEEERLEEMNKKESFKHQRQRFESVQKQLSFINVIDSYYLEGDFVIRYTMEQYERLLQDDKNVVFHIIVSNDNDLKQLMTDKLEYNVFVYDYKLGLLSQEDLKDTIDVNRIILEKQFMGDKSDNIQGIRGVGKKRQEKIISDIGDGIDQKQMSYNELREYLKNNLMNIKNSNLRKKVQENIETVVENYRMVNLINIDNVVDFLSFDLINRVNELVKKYIQQRKTKHSPLWKIKFLQKLEEEKLMDLLNKSMLFNFEITPLIIEN